MSSEPQGSKPLGVSPALRLADRRRDYVSQPLGRADLLGDPLSQLRRWLGEALAAELPEPTAMTLATARRGIPSARVVLLKGLSEEGLTFFTNRDSRKGRELAENPHAAACIVWLELHRQVRVVGEVSRLGEQESEEYFDSRPEGSRLAAWSSPQSEELTSRAELEARYLEATRKFAGGDIPKPPFWGGYLLRPREIEFWQGRPSRLHDRLVYSRDEASTDGWTIRRLAP